MRLITLLVLLITVSCATPYQKKGFMGGYTDSEIGQDMYEVTFSGNGHTGQGTVYNYLKQRCAELTLEKGFTHYVIVNNRESADVGAMTNFSTGMVTYYSKPENTAVIKLINNPPASLFAWDAAKILNRSPSGSK